ncbi:hypothetical protein D6D15_03787 [Aureobasidium pullulans]|uniref:Uncharacterized protein n=1 Tax=Aureobasidium pullulans TaxID=5580 RepID=A0A4S9BGJ0_AURPU|nr:hypothetical protein D6D15_03787 [Aureobasidium pullulans]
MPSPPSPFASFSSSHSQTNLLLPKTKPTPTTSIKMPAPNVDEPNQGIVGQIGNSIANAANYVSETISGNAAEASKEANKQQAKGNTADDSISGRVSGAMGAASDKLDQHSHEAQAKANKESI